VIAEVDVNVTFNNDLDSDRSAADSIKREDHLPKLGQYRMGHLPPKNEANVLQDTLRGFRGFKMSLAKLFDEEVVGRLATLTSISGTL
jgi:hypothetical protein